MDLDQLLLSETSKSGHMYCGRYNCPLCHGISQKDIDEKKKQLKYLNPSLTSLITDSFDNIDSPKKRPRNGKENEPLENNSRLNSKSFSFMKVHTPIKMKNELNVKIEFICFNLAFIFSFVKKSV
jgi:hypothetical protein